MCKNQETSNIIKSINSYKAGKKSDYELITEVCRYFDCRKNENLTEADLKFLKYISTVVGIPQFYDLLREFSNRNHFNNIENIDLNTLSCLIYEDTLYTTEKTKLHKYQKEILDKYKKEEKNRYFLSASTSFGKTHLVYEIINKMKYKNVLLIFPTIALLSENYEKIVSNKEYDFSKYKIHSLSDIKEIGECNIFIFTPERYLSYMEKENELKKFDFVFIDEIYKIDNDYIIDEQTKENERDLAYRVASYYAVQPDIDILLAGPYIEIAPEHNSFYKFLSRNNIDILNYNHYEIVNKIYKTITSKKVAVIDEGFEVLFTNTKSKIVKILDVVKKIREINENCIIYCPSRAKTQEYSKKLIEVFPNDYNTSCYNDFLNHIKSYYGEGWIVYKSLKKGIGIHHGLIPKYIQKEIIRLFNEKKIDVLLSTTTITEGVNTSAKNLLVTLAKKGDKSLKKFDAKNIAGRAGRFYQHYSGRVIIFDNDFNEVLKENEDYIKHKNYDKDINKDDIDLFYTEKEFLSETDQTKKIELAQSIKDSELPSFIFDTFKVISCSDKIKLYKIISENLLRKDVEISIKECIRQTQFNKINDDGFDCVLKCLQPIIKNEKLIFMIDFHCNGKWHNSLLTYLVKHYLASGFKGLVDYRFERNKNLDNAITETANFVYNILKYQLVKYLGAFNIIYKYCISIKEQKEYDTVVGFDKLLSKFEYNAFSDKAKMVSDYGVPNKIIEYYEQIDNNEQEANKIKQSFDTYESAIFEQIKSIIDKKDVH